MRSCAGARPRWRHGRHSCRCVCARLCFARVRLCACFGVGYVCCQQSTDAQPLLFSGPCRATWRQRQRENRSQAAWRRRTGTAEGGICGDRAAQHSGFIENLNVLNLIACPFFQSAELPLVFFMDAGCCRPIYNVRDQQRSKHRSGTDQCPRWPRSRPVSCPRHRHRPRLPPHGPGPGCRPCARAG